MLHRIRALLALVVAILVLVVGTMTVGPLVPAGAQATSTTESTTTTTAAPTTTTEPSTTTTEPSTTTTRRATTTTRRATTSSSTTSSSTTSTSTSTTSTTIAAPVVPPGFSDPSAGGPPFWSSGRKLGAVVLVLVALGLAMAALTFLYWRATRPGGAGPTGGVDTPPRGQPTGPIGPLDAMVADALRPDPIVARDDLGLT